MRSFANALLAALVCAIALSACRPALAADGAAVRAADAEFSRAAAKGDTAALGKLLDADFQWIDASGQVHSRAAVLKIMPKMLIPTQSRITGTLTSSARTIMGKSQSLKVTTTGRMFCSCG